MTALSVQACEEYLSWSELGCCLLSGLGQLLREVKAMRNSLDAGRDDDVECGDVSPSPSTSGEPDIEVVEEVDDIGSIVHPDDVSWIEVSSIMPSYCHCSMFTDSLEMPLLPMLPNIT